MSLCSYSSGSALSNYNNFYRVFRCSMSLALTFLWAALDLNTSKKVGIGSLSLTSARQKNRLIIDCILVKA